MFGNGCVAHVHQPDFRQHMRPGRASQPFACTPSSRACLSTTCFPCFWSRYPASTTTSLETVCDQACERLWRWQVFQLEHAGAGSGRGRGECARLRRSCSGPGAGLPTRMGAALPVSLTRTAPRCDSDSARVGRVEWVRPSQVGPSESMALRQAARDGCDAMLWDAPTDGANSIANSNAVDIPLS